MVQIDTVTPLGLELDQMWALSLLISERHVTRAATRFGVSQSTMSHRLKRLRARLGDELLVPHKGEMVLTPRAQAMQRPLEEALLALRNAVAPPESFAPRQAAGTLTLALPDLLAPFLPGLLETIRSEAPHIDLRIVGVPGNLATVLAEDPCPLAIAPAHLASDEIVTRRLGTLRFGTALRRGHPLLSGRMTLKRWLSYPHVVVSIGSPASNVISEFLAQKGLTRRTGLLVPGFLAGLHTVADSDLLMNVPLPLAQTVVHRLGLEVRSAPLSLPDQKLSLLFHARSQNDPLHGWLREKIRTFFASTLSSSGGAKRSPP